MSPLLLALAGLVAVATALFLRSDRSPTTETSENERERPAGRPRSAT